MVSTEDPILRYCAGHDLITMAMEAELLLAEWNNNAMKLSKYNSSRFR